jgi:hypothetical protein
VSSVPKLPALRRASARSLLSTALALFIGSTPGFSQALKSSTSLLKYDLQTETKAKGVVDDVKVFSFGTRKDFVQLILKDGGGTVVLYMCPKPFEDEMGISFAKGDQISFTGSKVKQEDSEVILARQVAKGEETLTFRDAKGSPVWDPRTGK